MTRRSMQKITSNSCTFEKRFLNDFHAAGTLFVFLAAYSTSKDCLPFRDR